MIISEINGLWTLLERVARLIKLRRSPKRNSVADRFLLLFQAHGIHPNQIPRYFDHGLTLNDLRGEDTLLPKLTESVLEDACSHFAIKREWLDGVEEDPYISHHCNLPNEFQLFIDGLIRRNPGAQLGGYLVVSTSTDAHSESILVIEESIGAVGEKPVYRHHICDGWVFEYWKSRAYLAACIAVAWKRNVFIGGRSVCASTLATLTERKSLIGPMLEQHLGSQRRWHAEDLALDPDEFLRGVDRELNNFGLISALRRWLSLEEEGWMDTGHGLPVRPLFEAELKRYEGGHQAGV